MGDSRRRGTFGGLSGSPWGAAAPNHWVRSLLNLEVTSHTSHRPAGIEEAEVLPQDLPPSGLGQRKAGAGKHAGRQLTQEAEVLPQDLPSSGLGQRKIGAGGRAGKLLQAQDCSKRFMDLWGKSSTEERLTEEYLEYFYQTPGRICFLAGFVSLIVLICVVIIYFC